MFQIWGEAGELLQTAIIFCSMFTQLGIYCWFGEELTCQVLATVKNKNTSYLTNRFKLLYHLNTCMVAKLEDFTFLIPTLRQ